MHQVRAMAFSLSLSLTNSDRLTAFRPFGRSFCGILLKSFNYVEGGSKEGFPRSCGTGTSQLPPGMPSVGIYCLYWFSYDIQSLWLDTHVHGHWNDMMKWGRMMGGEREGEKSKCHFDSFSLLFSSLTSRGFHSHISHGPKEGMRGSPSSGKDFELQIYSLVQNRFPTLVPAWHPDQPTYCQYGKVATWIHSTKLPFFRFSLQFYYGRFIIHFIITILHEE